MQNLANTRDDLMQLGWVGGLKSRRQGEPFGGIPHIQIAHKNAFYLLALLDPFQRLSGVGKALIEMFLVDHEIVSTGGKFMSF